MNTGRVVAVLPRALYRVALSGGHEVTAHVGGGTRKNFVRLVVGDRVELELTEKDSGRARIVKKVRTT